VLAACPVVVETPLPVFFPEDYETTYTEVRACRTSGDHFSNIRVLASPEAVEPYMGRVESFPEGAVVLKEEYDFGDQECSGPIVQWSVMQRLEEGSSAEMLDWTWQVVDADRIVVDQDKPACWGCHQGCGFLPDGYEGTCSIPP
jgi:hypothetical protein